MNLNFLNKDAQEEFKTLYGNDCSDFAISTYAYDKSRTNFDKIDNIIFEIIDAVFDCKWHNFNLDFQSVFGLEQDNERTYWITFWFEDIDFEYSPDGESTTTEYGVQVMNEHFKFKNVCTIKHTGYEMLQVTVTLTSDNNNNFNIME